jgi:hypothetical protein
MAHLGAEPQACVTGGDLLLEMSPRIRISIGPPGVAPWYQWAQDKGSTPLFLVMEDE